MRLATNLGGPSAPVMARTANRIINTPVTSLAASTYTTVRLLHQPSGVRRRGFRERPPWNLCRDPYRSNEPDLMFLKGIPFLISLITSLMLIFVRPLQNETAAAVKEQLDALLLETTSKYIDLRGLRCDKGSQLGKILPIPDRAIIANKVRPGQRTSHVEHAIQTAKERIRGFDAALLFIMCAAILACILFCARGINWSGALTSPSRVSLME